MVGTSSLGFVPSPDERRKLERMEDKPSTSPPTTPAPTTTTTPTPNPTTTSSPTTTTPTPTISTTPAPTTAPTTTNTLAPKLFSLANETGSCNSTSFACVDFCPSLGLPNCTNYFSSNQTKFGKESNASSCDIVIEANCNPVVLNDFISQDPELIPWVHSFCNNVTNNATKQAFSCKLPKVLTPAPTSSVAITSPPTPSDSSSSNTGAIVGSVVGVVALAAIVAFFLYRRKKSSSKDTALSTTPHQYHEMSPHTKNTANSNPRPSPADKGAEIALPVRSPATSTSSEKKDKASTQSLLTQLSQRDDLKPLWMFIEALKTTTIKGGHNLFSCNVSGSKVALKGMDYPAASQESRMNFIKAIHFIQQVRSPYITRLTGVCLMNFQTRLCVVTEYMDKGCLGAVATDANIELSEENKYKICHCIASGLAYLHPKRAYGHLTNEKVLINSDFEAKLNVFEMMKKYYLESRYVTSSFGSFEVVYQAPELRKVTGGEYSTSTDIYALGVLMAEVFVRERPFKKLYEEKGFLGGDVYLYEHPKLRPFELDSRVPEGMRSLIEQCWHENPLNRPNISQIVEQLAKNVPTSA